MPYADPLGLVGQQLGPYVVRELVTAGGVALIYRGEHEALKSAVAVKVLRPELVEDAVRPTFEQMFLREAQILSQLRSEDILRALDHGRVACPGDGVERPYIVVDWLEGHPLNEELERRAMDRRPYTLPEAIELLEPVARALSVCHEAGIVHRDVNPRNVFLENLGPGRPLRAKLIDFGFAKEVARTEALRLQRVDGTLMARSPDYAAPEHYDRETYGELSENTDIYTFALMLVEMLTLVPPLRGMTDAELQASTTNRDDRPTPNGRGANVSPAVEALFREALAIDQFERPGVLWEFWTRLKAAAAPPELLPDASGPGPEPERAEAPATSPRRRGPLIAAILGLSILGVTGAAAFRWSRQPLGCPAGFADCNGERADGCETDLRRDAANCGACRSACTAAGTTCVDAQCQVATCAPHLGDCNHNAADGCETDLATDDKNCGACGTTCSAEGAKEARCVASKCQATCRSGYGDCDGIASDGCETSLATDAKNCGRCGVTCGSAECREGLCAPTVLLSPVSTRTLAIDGGAVYFWDEQKKAIARVTSDGNPSAVVPNVPSVTALAVGGGRVVWLTAEHGLFAHPLDDTNAAPLRLSAPLASETPLVLSASGYLSWSNRAVSEGNRHGARGGALPPSSLRRVISAPLDALLDKGKTTTVECPTSPRTFIADAAGAYCCDATKPLVRAECERGRCTSDAYDALCPEELRMDGERLYFVQDVRVLSLDRKSGKLKALTKRKKRPRALALGAGFLYWLEGERSLDVWRIAADPADGTAPELLARHEAGVTSLVADGSALYFVADSPRGGQGAIYTLPLPSR